MVKDLPPQGRRVIAFDFNEPRFALTCKLYGNAGLPGLATKAVEKLTELGKVRFEQTLLDVGVDDNGRLPMKGGTVARSSRRPSV